MGNNSGGCVGSGGGVGVGVHEARVLAGGTMEWVVVCRRLECWMEEMLHRSLPGDKPQSWYDVARTMVRV